MATKSPPQLSDAYNPAPYGGACVGCSRAKSKCFYRAGIPQCERCQRLGKECEQSQNVRKRKAPASSVHPPAPAPAQPAPSSRLEEKLDSLVSLLHSQAMDKQAAQGHVATYHTPATSSDTSSLYDTSFGFATSPFTLPPMSKPDIILDHSDGIIHLMRPTSPPTLLSPIFSDVSVYKIPSAVADEQLAFFRSAFLPVVPFLHLPAHMAASELQYQRPFLWLVIMCLTNKIISQQWAMADTVWSIISRRIVQEHHADMDVLLGLICFGSWSHYFKKDRPFMVMLAQLAVSIAFDLDLEKDVSATVRSRNKSSRISAQKPSQVTGRTLEERRTILAVYHITSSSWSAYRKTYPFRWTAYLDECASIVGEGKETRLDILLVTQIKCQLLASQLTCPSDSRSLDGETSSAPSSVLITMLLRQLNEIQQGLPADIRTQKMTQFYLHSTELTIRDYGLGIPSAPDKMGMSQLKRLKNLDETLSTIERWLEVFQGKTASEWAGLSVDHFSQFMHCLVVLFKLTTTTAHPDWRPEDVRQRADLIRVLDHVCAALDRLSAELGIVEPSEEDGGPRSLFWKAKFLFRAVRALFVAEMGGGGGGESSSSGPSPAATAFSYDSGIGQSNSSDGAAAVVGDFAIPDEFLVGLSAEPWLTDIYEPWNFDAGDFFSEVV